MVRPAGNTVGEAVVYQAVPSEDLRIPLTMVYFSGNNLDYFESVPLLESLFGYFALGSILIEGFTLLLAKQRCR